MKLIQAIQRNFETIKIVLLLQIPLLLLYLYDQDYVCSLESAVLLDLSGLWANWENISKRATWIYQPEEVSTTTKDEIVIISDETVGGENKVFILV